MKTKKRCTHGSCQGLLFARGLCHYHYRTVYLAGKAKDKPRKKYHIPKISEKTKQRNLQYKANRLDFITTERRKDSRNKIYCIFCGKEIKGEPSLHHGFGRDDDVMLDKVHWYLSHNFCHVHQYHSMSWTDIPWWNDYIDRIKVLNPLLYEKELQRMDKQS